MERASNVLGTRQLTDSLEGLTMYEEQLLAVHSALVPTGGGFQQNTQAQGRPTAQWPACGWGIHGRRMNDWAHPWSESAAAAGVEHE